MVIGLAGDLRACETSAPQCWQAQARCRDFVGLGYSGRCEPACGLPFAFGSWTSGAEGFCPLLGGVLELSGVFVGRSSFASSSATRATSVSHCLVNAAIVSPASGPDGSAFPCRADQALRKSSKA